MIALFDAFLAIVSITAIYHLGEVRKSVITLDGVLTSMFVFAINAAIIMLLLFTPYRKKEVES